MKPVLILAILGLLLLFQACSQEPVTPDQSTSSSNTNLVKGKPQPVSQVFPPLSNGPGFHIAACALHTLQAASELMVWSYSPDGSISRIWKGHSTSTDLTVGYSGVDLGDLNQDGNKELAALAIYTPSSGKRVVQSYAIEVYKAGSAEPAQRYSLSGIGGTNNMARSLDIADIDHDGKLEVLLAASQTLQVWQSNGTTLENPSTYKFSDLMFGSLCPGDPDQDGDTEIIAGADQYGLVILESETGSWVPHEFPVPGAGDFVVDARVVDFGTGSVSHPVIVCCGFNRRMIYVCEYTKEGSVNWLFSSDDLGAYPQATAAGDFDGNGTVQLAVGMANPGLTLIYRIGFNNGSYSLDQNPARIATSFIDDMCTWNDGQVRLAASGSSLYLYSGNGNLKSYNVGQELLQVTAK